MESKGKIKQIFHHYKKWEDWQAGMYRVCQIDESLINKAKELLSSQSAFYKTSNEMVKAWKFAAEQNLTDKGQNRRAWVGQAACCFQHGTPEHLTRLAWRELESRVQDEANHIADIIIFEFERSFFKQKRLFNA